VNILPTRRKFHILARSGHRVPVAACLPLESDARSLFEAVAFDPPHVLLESARVHPVTGRYSLIVGEPIKTLTAFGDQVRIQEKGREQSLSADPFTVMGDLLRSNPAVRVPGLPPFVGGAVGVIGFEAARMLERIPSRAQDDLHLPDLAFLFCDEAIVLDHLERKLWVIALDRSYDRAVEKIEHLADRIRPPRTGRDKQASEAERPRCPEPKARDERDRRLSEEPRWGDERPAVPPGSTGGLISTHTQASFEAMVRRAKEFIAAGDIYQTNLSQRFTVPLREDPWQLYRRLTEINPSPFAAFVDLGFAQIVSASPERFIRVQRDRIETRPIAGTRPKGKTTVETARLRKELILNEKERAEHLMLVDLERNDLGRVCRYDTVEVDDLMAMEEYSHVIHIVSNVRGKLRPGVGFKDLMKAAFPGGTISGCPKVRCLEIIDELEPVRRHFYTGSLGYLSATGDMDMNLLIRTAVIQGGQAHIQAGAGIVADSDPSREYDETLHKAQALLETIGAVHAEPAACPV